MRIKDLEINEMTMRFSNMDKIATKYVNQNKETWWDDGVHIGDIEDYNLRKYDMIYSLWDKDVLVASTSLDTNKTIPEVDKVWVNPDYRGQKIFSKMLWFYKTRLHHSQLLLGEIHSSDMQEVIKGLSRFTKSWYKDGVVEPFDLNTVDNYYSWAESTGWQIILENNGKFVGWPKFAGGDDWIKQSYEGFVD